MKKTFFLRQLTSILPACFALVVLCTAVQADPLFYDDFTAGPSPLWGNEVGSWVAPAGEYYAEYPDNSPMTYTGLPYDLGDFSADVDVNDAYDGGIWIHSRDNGNGILLVTGGGLTGYGGMNWHIVSEGNAGAGLNPVGGLFTPGDDITVRVEAEGTDYRAYLNGSPTPATTLSTAAWSSPGKFALYSNSDQTFDNVAIVPEPGSVALLALGALGLALYRRRRK